MMKHSEIINEMTLEEKCSLLSGGTQFGTKSVHRLGIPEMMFADGPNGIRKQAGEADHLGLHPSVPATCFPTLSTLSNSWDEPLLAKIGNCLAEEAVEQRVNVVLGPGINIKRSPLCGRNFEYFSEDPYLSGKLAAAYIRGVQSKGIAACPKHFAVNSQERLRMHSDSILDERTMREIYLTAFEIAVKEGKPDCLMSSYNRVNGVYASENKFLLQDVLRDEWGFKGFVVTDWGGSNDRVKGLEAGGNLEMPTNGGDGDRQVAQAVKTNRISQALLDKRVEEYLEVLEKTVIPEQISNDSDKEAHHKIAQEAAAESIVLLKNDDDILPLKTNTRVAVIGPFAEEPRYQGAGSSCVNAIKVEKPLEVLKESGLNIAGYAEGFRRYGQSDEKLLREAIELAKHVETVLLYMGLDELSETEGRDREHMKMQSNQEFLLREIAKVNSNIVVIFSGGAPVEMPWIDKCKGLLHGYLGGEAGAGAMAEIIAGKRSPSGKLAETWAIKYEDTPAFSYYPGKEKTAEYREGIFVGYRYYDSAKVPVRFPFGYGLSYTKFEYSKLELIGKTLSFTLTNTGQIKGKEIAQIYVGKGNSNVFRASKELKGFVKVELEPGESKRITVPLDDKAFRYWNVKTGKWEVEPGIYQIMVGESSRSIKLSSELSIEGATVEVPYDEEKLPSYFSGNVKQVDKEEFAKLLNRNIPQERWNREKPLEINDTFVQLSYAKSWIGRLVYKITKKQVEQSEHKGKPDLDALFRYYMPFRAIAKMTDGAVNMEMTEALLQIFNGHFFEGLTDFISAFRRKRKEEKKWKYDITHKNPCKEVDG